VEEHPPADGAVNAPNNTTPEVCIRGTCQECGRQLPYLKRTTSKYCSRACNWKHWWYKQAAARDE